MKYIVLLSVAASLAFSYAPQSFRMQSTAGIWEDDYDLIFDPARIAEIQGHRIYTNLSNYVTSDERQFGPNAANFFLVGGSTRLGKQAFSAVFDRHAFSQPQFTGLFDAYTKDSLFGSARSDSVAWLDPDTNGTYDSKQVRREERNAWRYGWGDDVFIGVGVLGKKSRLGIAVAFNDSSRTAISPSSDYVSRQYDSSLFAGRLTYLRDDTAHRTDRTDRTNVSVVLSGRFELKGGAILGVLLRPALVRQLSGYGRNVWIYADRNPGNPTTKDYTLTRLRDTLRTPYQGVDVPVSLQWVRTNPGKAETRLTLSGFYDQQTLDQGAGQEFASFYEQTTNPGLNSFWDTLTRSNRGANGSRGITAGLLNLHWVGSRLDLGWGARFGFTASTDSLFDSTRHVVIERMDDGDTLQTVGDYVRRVSSAESWLRRTIGRQMTLTIPVGLEFRVIPSIGLRLGASHTLSWDDAAATSQLLSLSPTHTRTEYGDGSFYETWETPQRRTTSSENRHDFSQTTAFTYGVGFRPLDQLQIDLMGFADLTNLTNWRLSATFRF